MFEIQQIRKADGGPFQSFSSLTKSYNFWEIRLLWKGELEYNLPQILFPGEF